MVKIVLIVGASGVGKDTLLKAIQNVVKANFITRYITRVPDNNESNYYIGKDDFEHLRKSDFFVSSWEAHGNIYGISQTSIKDGLNIISISREAIKILKKNLAMLQLSKLASPKNYSILG
ncbi:MAG: hypothetical protein KN64_15115 [Sulfurovum sp. AS07-7]|nr:MAG: hypothetical protein KN64_15115 [Sulfurovum sp. AS07-7]